MTFSESQSAAIENVVKGIKIPPQPVLLASINEELQKDEVNLNRVAELTSQDVAVSAAVLKTVNSAFFGLKNEIVSIRHAISLLGVTVTINIVCGFLLKQALGESPAALPRFWDTAENVARACAFIARRLNIMDADPPYTLGLFHDAGIPLMAQRFPDYLQTLAAANEADLKLFTDLEEQHYNTSHAVIGYMISREWGLPKDLREAILLHHDVTQAVNEDTPSDSTTARLLCILKLAEMADSVQRNGQTDADWERFKIPVMDFLQLSEPDVGELVADVSEMLLTDQLG